MLRRRCCLFATVAAKALQRSNDGSSSPPQRAESVPPLPVYLKPSSSPHRKPSFYFPRMRDETRPVYAFQPDRLGSALPLFNITTPSCEYYALRLPLLKAGFRRVPAGRYDAASNLLWGRSMPFREMLRQESLTQHLDFPPVSTPEQAAYLDKLTMVNAFQRFNHYPLSHANLGCKRGMATNIRDAWKSSVKAAGGTPAAREAAQRRYGFMPRTWFYPQEKEKLVAAMKAAPSSMHFIWKPARGSCGRGILISEGGERNTASWERVMREIEAKASSKDSGRIFRNYVVQEYIDNPFLVEGRKMDLRLYVAVTSYDPLTVYWHEEGLARLAAEPYSDTAMPFTPTPIDMNQIEEEALDGDAPDLDLRALAPPPPPPSQTAVSKHLHDRFRHLTNYSIGRRYVAMQQAAAPSAKSSLSDGAAEANAGASVPELKWPLQRLWDYIDATAAGYSVMDLTRRPSDKVREEIAQLITRTLMAARPVISSATHRMPMPGSFFELYGFDVMLDAHLNPFLIEVNTLPSLESSSSFDYATKTNVVADLLNVAMLEPFEREVKPGGTLWSASAVREGALQPLAAAEKALVHSASHCEETAKPGFENAASRDDVVLRLRDELAYARGFQRIFPAKPVPGFNYAAMGDSIYNVSPFTPLSHAEHPLDSLGARSTYLEDVRAYEAHGLLTQQDLWALES